LNLAVQPLPLADYTRSRFLLSPIQMWPGHQNQSAFVIERHREKWKRNLEPVLSRALDKIPTKLEAPHHGSSSLPDLLSPSQKKRLRVEQTENSF
jgi:hypothetical protein